MNLISLGSHERAVLRHSALFKPLCLGSVGSMSYYPNTVHAKLHTWIQRQERHTYWPTACWTIQCLALNAVQACLVIWAQSPTATSSSFHRQVRLGAKTWSILGATALMKEQHDHDHRCRRHHSCRTLDASQTALRQRWSEVYPVLLLSTRFQAQ